MPRDIHERAKEIVSIFNQLKGMNLGIMEYEEFRQFKSICNSFIRDGESVKGRIPVLGTKRIIQYNFNDSATECFLKYDESV